MLKVLLLSILMSYNQLFVPRYTRALYVGQRYSNGAIGNGTQSNPFRGITELLNFIANSDSFDNGRYCIVFNPGSYILDPNENLALGIPIYLSPNVDIIRQPGVGTPLFDNTANGVSVRIYGYGNLTQQSPAGAVIFRLNGGNHVIELGPLGSAALGGDIVQVTGNALTYVTIRGGLYAPIGGYLVENSNPNLDLRIYDVDVVGNGQFIDNNADTDYFEIKRCRFNTGIDFTGGTVANINMMDCIASANLYTGTLPATAILKNNIVNNQLAPDSGGSGSSTPYPASDFVDGVLQIPVNQIYNVVIVYENDGYRPAWEFDSQENPTLLTIDMGAQPVSDVIVKLT